MDFSAIVIRGGGRGRGLGCPTANLDLTCEAISLPDGVYAARSTLGERVYVAALVVDRRFGKVEAHLLDFADRDLYGETLAVEVFQKVSDIAELTATDLPKKIATDVRLIRAFFIGN